MQYQMLIQNPPDGLFSAFVIGIPDIVAEGATLEEAVHRLGPYSIWRESASDYLPWDEMHQAIKRLDKEKKLRLEIKSPGNWEVHSLQSPPAEPEPAATATAEAKSSKSKKPRRKKSSKWKSNLTPSPAERPAPNSFYSHI